MLAGPHPYRFPDGARNCQIMGNSITQNTKHNLVLGESGRFHRMITSLNPDLPLANSALAHGFHREAAFSLGSSVSCPRATTISVGRGCRLVYDRNHASETGMIAAICLGIRTLAATACRQLSRSKRNKKGDSIKEIVGSTAGRSTAGASCCIMRMTPSV